MFKHLPISNRCHLAKPSVSKYGKRAIFSVYSQPLHVPYVRVSMHGRCRAWPWLSEYSGVVLSCYTLSRSTVLTDVSLLEPEDSFNPSLKAVIYSVLSVRKRVNTHAVSREQ